MPTLPRGFTAHTANLGIKDDTTDFTVVLSDVQATCAAVFTQSRFAGPSVEISRENCANGSAHGVVVISKNANVANGQNGRDDACEVLDAVSSQYGVSATDLLLASTGVIGRRYPMEKIRPRLNDLRTIANQSNDASQPATAIMTTDTRPKVVAASAGGATVVGIAKGVGMIEPNMATMLAFLFTDAEVDPADLDRIFRRVVDRTFNSLSVDSDTSTSDSAIILANGLAGPVSVDEIEIAIAEVCLGLTRMLASDGEGATTLIEVTCRGAADERQAKTVAKSIVNSPLVKTAVFGRDPNWGRIAMAVGKVNDDRIDANQVTIYVGDVELYPSRCGDSDLEMVSEYLAGDEVKLAVDLGCGDGSWTVWGCDLSYDYVRINADYTT